MSLVFLAAATIACASLRPDGLAELAKARGGAVKLVFFASWCAGCKPSIETADQDASSVLVGAFDKKERLEAVVAALGTKAPCFVDAGVAESLGVSALPRSIVWRSSL